MKVLINRTDAIGDTLLTMPMAEYIKDKYPKAKVIFLVSPRSAPLLLHHPWISEVWTIPSNRSWLVKLIFLFKRILKEDLDAYFYVGGTHLPSFLTWLLRVKIRGGIKSRWPAFLYLNYGMRQKRSMVEMHEAEYNLNLLRPLDIVYDYRERESIPAQVFLTTEDIELGKKTLSELWTPEKMGADLPYLIIHPGMRGHTLNWPAKNYARFIERFERTYPGKFRYVLSYTPVDGPYITPLKSFIQDSDSREITSKILFLDGQSIGLRTYMSIVKNAAFFLGPSTGTTHIAHQLNVPTIGIYSPIKVQSALRWSPFPGNKVKIMVPDVVCGERFVCAGEICPYYECMGKIEVDDVVRASAELLGLSLTKIAR
jgi:ADP-heptose:LPS heptosyltransferase